MADSPVQRMQQEVAQTRDGLIALFTGLVEIGVVPRDKAAGLLEDVIAGFPPARQASARRVLADVLED